MNGLAQLAVQQKFLIVLQSNKARFRQSSVDLKAWGLRENKPPEAPFVILPNDGKPISESYIRSIWADTKLPLGFVRHGDKKSRGVESKQDWYKLIQGKHFVASTSSRLENHHQNYEGSHDRSNSLGFNVDNHFDEDDEIPVKFIIEKDKIGKFSGCKIVATPSTSSASSVATTKVTDSNENSRDVFDDTSRDSIILVPKAPTNKRRLRKRSAPLSGPGPANKTKIEKLLIPSPEDSSNDDDTSSKSTLDLIIPAPKDFQGCNNPFNPVYVPQTTGAVSAMLTKVEPEKEVPAMESKKVPGKRLTKIKGASKPPPESSKIRIVRTIRRRLSAKDIIIGPNQEVKYKKKSKHRNEDVEVSSFPVLFYITTHNPLFTDY